MFLDREPYHAYRDEFRRFQNGWHELNSRCENFLRLTDDGTERRSVDSTNRIPLLLSPVERNALFQLASKCSPEGEIVEIGSYKGGSTVLLALASGRDVYAVDPHTLTCPGHGLATEVPAGLEASMSLAQEFRDNLEKANVKSLVHEVPQSSVEAVRDWNKPISLLFIDGCHHFECVKNDFRLWSPFLINGGILVMHDVPILNGPRRVFWDNVFKSHELSNLHLKDRLAWGIKVKSSRTTSLANRFSMLTCMMFRLIRSIRSVVVDSLVSRTGANLGELPVHVFLRRLILPRGIRDMLSGSDRSADHSEE